ncbi:MAG TPA: hypothetical protein VD973_02520 [Symbiobacteriaceae bacterium]|jgi:hypothetical protein|nr:hypothetical protein [Symbiobacteriaceae bacterium]
MNWLLKKGELAQQLSPDVACFVLRALRNLEQENVFDAPGIISGVLRQMRIADSDVVRAATARTERLLKSTFAQGAVHRLGA